MEGKREKVGGGRLKKEGDKEREIERRKLQKKLIREGNILTIIKGTILKK